MRFEWDEAKNRENIIKHKVSFEEATSIFLNPVLEEPDIAHSENEDRYVAIGISAYYRELIVCYCVREKIDNEKVIRLITARKANEDERRKYYERQL